MECGVVHDVGLGLSCELSAFGLLNLENGFGELEMIE